MDGHTVVVFSIHSDVGVGNVKGIPTIAFAWATEININTVIVFDAFHYQGKLSGTVKRNT